MLEIKSRMMEAVMVVDLSGEISLSDRDNDKLRRRFLDCFEREISRIILNLHEVSRIDSSGIGEIVVGFRWARDVGGDVKLCGLNQTIQEIFMTTKLDTIFDIAETETEALARFALQIKKG